MTDPRKRSFLGPVPVIILFIFLVGTGYALFQSFDWTELHPASRVPRQEQTGITPEIQVFLDSLTLEQKIGQMMMVGFWGTFPDAHIREVLTTGRAGGVILLKYNIQSDAQLKQLTASLQDLNIANQAGLPLLIAVDQEGGMVVRVRTESVHEFTAQKEILSEEQAYQVAYGRGLELKQLGININFSPVLDIIDTEASFLSQRVFSGPLEERSSFGAAMVHGYQDAEILSVPKHFPGHADDMADSHDELPSSDLAFEEVRQRLLPFRTVIEEQQPSMVMTAHVVYPVIDGQSASLSNEWNRILRGWAGHEGVVITDDMEMGAVMSNYSAGEAAVKAVQAGSDMVLFVSTASRQDDAYEALLQAVMEGTIPLERIDESVARIIRMKIMVR